jgi:hypothetical protein
LSQSLSAITADEILLDTQSFIKLGINELVTYETMNREIDNIQDNLELLRLMLEPRFTYDTTFNICWNWKNQSMTRPQAIVTGNIPFSWYELRKDVAKNIAYLSGGTTWNDLKTCCGEANSVPIKWTWKHLTCCDNPAISWAEAACDRVFATSWKDLRNNCERKPNYYFDDCVPAC